MYSTSEIIDNYRRGISYKRLTINELVEVSPDKIDELASEYEINKSDYGITNEAFNSYCFELHNCASDYWNLKQEKIENNTDRWILFVVFVTIIISVIVFIISGFFAVICIIIIGWLVHKYLYPKFEEWYRNNLIEKFLKEHKIQRNYKVENYINEVMFQAYARNKNAERKKRCEQDRI